MMMTTSLPNRQDIEDQLRKLLGLHGEETEIYLYLSSLPRSEIGAYLASLIPGSNQAFVQKVISHFDKDTKSSAKEPTRTSRENKIKVVKNKPTTNRKSKSPAKDKKSTSNPKQGQISVISNVSNSVKAAQSKIITGNENNPDTVYMNCLDCGMIYERRKYDELSQCIACEQPVGKGQKKRVKNRTKSELQNITATESSNHPHPLQRSAAAYKNTDEMESENAPRELSDAGITIQHDPMLRGTASQLYAKLSQKLTT